ncbi:Kelch repeat-containing protein [Mucilaginibacter ginkgonis]|uniref:N-acetylneuraminic acid mutarotase n=1 Tax=Mucilaginibacter ginkgonis TaxID=2682091 RepID=A0A6I4HYZ2_9SPHI|nr:kelch-like protein [Mucilaginibacter ginkgonis]QQL49311.1 hypothetical protein GO620_014190 [Mucilaginibacter ginkgonis]
MKKHKLTLAALLLFSIVQIGFAQKPAQPFLKFDDAPNMPYRLLWPAVVNSGPSIYAINGYAVYAGGYSSNILEFNTATQKWKTVSNGMGYKAQSEAAYVSSTNTTYVFGGVKFGGNSVYREVQKIDMASGAITTLHISNPMASAYGTALEYDGNIYILGGTADDKHTINSTYKFEPATQKFTKLADMPESLETAGALVNGVIYTFGGYDQFLKRMSTTISAYDIKANKWAVVGKLPDAVSANSVAVYRNLIFVIGGYDKENFLGYYDTESKTFTKLHSNFEGRRAAGAAVVGDKLYVFGGASRFALMHGTKSVQVADLKQFAKSYTADFK